ncbi:MAG: hypothetical protein ACKOBK_00570 [Acidimicrobiaceae bacterium]
MSHHVEVDVHELIDALTPEFAAAYANQSERPEVKRFSSLKDWRREFKKISKNSVVFTHVRPINLQSALICVKIHLSGSKVVGFSTGGVPFSDFRLSPDKHEFPTSVKRVLHFARRNLLRPLMPGSVLVGGSEEVARVSRDYPRSTRPILANSSDYSNCLRLGKRTSESQNSAIYLDTGFPGFPRDEVIEKIVEQVSGADWYPKLNRFFDLVELVLATKVNVAIHPKHVGRDHQPMFGSRSTIGGETPEMVSKCSLVIATNSTSISYAVAFAKPLILVTSDQIQNGRDQYKASLIANIAKETGARIFNIDREYTEKELREALVIDHVKRESYKRKYLTSRTDDKPNYQVLLDEVINAVE